MQRLPEVESESASTKGIPTKKRQTNLDAAILREDGRWEEVTVGAEEGKLHITHSSLYGYDWASKDTQKLKLNEELIGKAILRMLEVGDAPYLFQARNPEESHVIKKMVERGLVVDIPAVFGRVEQHTFARSRG